jgi:hypothetical protein
MKRISAKTIHVGYLFNLIPAITTPERIDGIERLSHLIQFLSDVCILPLGQT